MTIFFVFGALLMLAFVVFFYRKRTCGPVEKIVEIEEKAPAKKENLPKHHHHHPKPSSKHHKHQNVKHKELIDSFKHFQANVIDFDMKPKRQTWINPNRQYLLQSMV